MINCAGEPVAIVGLALASLAVVGFVAYTIKSITNRLAFKNFEKWRDRTPDHHQTNMVQFFPGMTADQMMSAIKATPCPVSTGPAWQSPWPSSERQAIECRSPTRAERDLIHVRPGTDSTGLVPLATACHWRAAASIICRSATVGINRARRSQSSARRRYSAASAGFKGSSCDLVPDQTTDWECRCACWRSGRRPRRRRRDRRRAEVDADAGVDPTQTSNGSAQNAASAAFSPQPASAR
jgi:hypothetical protein